MAKWIWIIGLALVFGQASAGRASAAQNTNCDQRQRVLGHLANKYKEAPVAIGVTNAGGLVEVLSTGDGQTWTIIVSNPDGLTCLLATGEGWRAIQSDRTKLDPEA
jgi:hypothetical protein